MNKPAPNRIPLAGDDEKIQARNYFTMEGKGKSNNDKFYVKSICSGGYETCYWADEESDGFDVSFPIGNLKSYNIRYTFYFQELELVYTNELRFLWGVLTFQNLRKLWARKLQQKRFNRRNLESASRLEVLRWCRDERIYRDSHAFSHYSFLSSKHGTRWVCHPQKDELLRYYRWIMNSLVESGDLRDTGPLRYELAPKGLVTIIDAEREERRHLDNICHQARLGRLTYALVFVGLLQVGVSLLTDNSVQELLHALSEYAP